MQHSEELAEHCVKTTKKFGFMAIAICMMAVMVSIASWQLMINIQQRIQIDRTHTSIKREYARQMDEAQERYAAAEIAKQNTPQALATLAFENIQTTGTPSFVDSELEFANEFEISDEDAFLYSLIFIDLMSFGYDVFPAIATIFRDTEEHQVCGLAYTDWSEAYGTEIQSIGSQVIEEVLSRALSETFDAVRGKKQQ